MEFKGLDDFLKRYPQAWEVIMRYWKENFIVRRLPAPKKFLLLGHYYGPGLAALERIQRMMEQKCTRCADPTCSKADVRLARNFEDLIKEKHIKSILLGRLSHYRIFLIGEDRGGVMIELPELTAPPAVLQGTHVWAHVNLRDHGTELLREGIFLTLQQAGHLHFFDEWTTVGDTIIEGICELVRFGVILGEKKEEPSLTGEKQPSNA